MKTNSSHFLLALTLLSMLLIGSCTNLDSVNDRIDDHEKRLNQLDNLVKSVNDNIKNLKALAEAEKDNLAIVKYTPLEDNAGYKLEMSDGSTIILNNGLDGITPSVGIKKDTDGVFYWTINGEFMLDAYGNKIMAKGTNGSDGITPLLQVNADGFWEVSLNQGKSYQLLLGKDGNPIKAKGETAKIDFSITETEDSVVINYNGNEYILPRSNKIVPKSITIEPTTKVVKVNDTFEIKATILPENVSNPAITWESEDDKIATVSAGTVTAVSVGTVLIKATTVEGNLTATCRVTVKAKNSHVKRLPIDYVAEFNIDKTGKNFVTSHSNTAGGYFDWDDADRKFSKRADFKINGQGYYMPTMKEWCAVVPFRNVYFIEFRDVLNQEESFVFLEKSYNLKADYKFPGNGVAYAIRFKGGDNLLRSAYKFEYTKNPQGNGSMMIITARYLGDSDTETTIDDVAKPEYWNSNNEDDTIRYFPCSGYKDFEENNMYSVGEYGNYWSATSHDSLFARRMLFGGRDATSNEGGMKTNGRSIRLFMKK